MNKYDAKNRTPFIDPIVRCDACQELLLRKTIQEIGCCTNCGNRRMTNIKVIKEAEIEKVKSWNLDPEFMALFEEAENPQEVA
jgi:hypothetical protein